MQRKFILLLHFLVCGLLVFAQNKDLTIEFVGKQSLKTKAMALPKNHSEILNYNDSTVAIESPFRESANKLATKMTITYKNKQFDVETLMGTEIAPKAGILVKYGSGDPLVRARRHEFKVIYYDLDNGNKLFELPKKYEGAGCSLSKNGLLAMTGRLLGYKDIEGSHVSLYDKKGKEIFTKSLGSDNWVRDIRISEKGNYIAMVYTTLRAQPPNKRFNLMIMRNDGTVLFDKRYYNTYFHHLIFSPDENHFIGIAPNYICLFDIKSKKLRWEQNKYYRTGRSPVMFFENFNCVLIHSTLSENWTLHLLDIDSGSEIHTMEIPDKQVVLRKRTLYQKNKEEFMIKNSRETYNFKISSRK